MAEFWQLTFPVPGQSETSAKRAEANGWDGLYFADTQCLSGDIYSAMCLAAKATTTLQVGTAVTNPVTRHPAVTASAIATVQVESQGRAVLGIGRGDSSLGYIGQQPAPVGVLTTYLEQLQGYLRGEAVDLDGFASHNMWIADSGQPKVPVDVAATGPKVIATSARLADRITFAMGADAARLQAGIVSARNTRESAGLDPDDLTFGAYICIACDDDIARARDIVRGTTGTFAHFTGMSKRNSIGLADASIFEHIGENYDMDNHAKGASGHMAAVPDEFVSRFAITGSDAYCVDRLGKFLDIGLDRMILLMGSRDSNPAHVMLSQQRIASEVLPQLR